MVYPSKHFLKNSEHEIWQKRETISFRDEKITEIVIFEIKIHQTMSAKSLPEDFPVFSECENQVVEFESTWNLERCLFQNCFILTYSWFIRMNSFFYHFYWRVYDKAVPIPTQTDPINKPEHKSTNSQESKHSAVSVVLHFKFNRCKEHNPILSIYTRSPNLFKFFFNFNFQSQTEPLLKSQAPVNEKKLMESLRVLSALMESEVKLGTTNVFKFQAN